MSAERGGGSRSRLRGPQDVAAGVFVIVLAAIALWALAPIRTASYATFSPALFPRICAYVLAAGGAVLILRGLVRPGAPLVGLPPRPMLLVTAAVVVFGLVAPVFGYVPAGLLTMLIGGAAAPETRPRELAALAAGLAVLSVLLFTLLLKLPLPALIIPGLRI
jgi:hypothetical protein